MWTTPQYLPIEGYGDIAFRDTGEVHSDTQASKPVILFVHGLGLNSLFWTPVVEYLRNDFRCVAIDLPGHGMSVNVRGEFSMTWFSVLLRRFIEKINFSDFTLAGHSMGGQISIITALQMPAAISKLVLACSAGVERFSKEDGEKFMKGAEFLYKAPMDMQHLVAMYTMQMSKRMEHAHELYSEHLTQQKEKFTQFSAMLLACMKGMLNEPVQAFLPDIQQPTLVMYGDADRLIPNKILHPTMTTADVANEAAALIPNSIVEVVKNCGHYLPFEDPHVVAKRVREFYLAD